MGQTVETAAGRELFLNYSSLNAGEFIYDRNAMINMFKKGAEWQAKQPLTEEQVDTKLSEYIDSTEFEAKLKLAEYSVISISGMAIDANSAKTTLGVEFDHNGKRYEAEMVITQKEIGTK